MDSECKQVIERYISGPKGKITQPTIICPAKPSFLIELERKNFYNKQKLTNS
jgi:hypothetical protein